MNINNLKGSVKNTGITNMKKTCHIKGCRSYPKFTIEAELVGYKSDVKMCQTHLLLHLRGASQAITDTIGKALAKIAYEKK